MGEVTLRHEIVCLKNAFDVGPMDADGDAHEEMLWPLGHATVELQEVGPLQCLEPEAT